MPGGAPVTIERLDGPAAQTAADELAALLVDAVEGGASVGFARPMALEDARAWAEGVASDVVALSAILLVARQDDGVCGTVQLRFSAFPNGRYRGEVAKLMVHRLARRKGIGARLMETIEVAAREAGLRTLFLDTETESDAERLYQSLGWSRAGVIPEFALSPNGGLRDSSFYYKLL